MLGERMERVSRRGANWPRALTWSSAFALGLWLGVPPYTHVAPIAARAQMEGEMAMSKLDAYLAALKPGGLGWKPRE